MNWSAIPWKKVILVAISGAFGAAAVAIPDTVLIMGVSVQHVLIAAAAAMAGWAKRAPGDIKAG